MKLPPSLTAQMTPMVAYRGYQSIKMHFQNEKYDVFKYNGGMKNLPERFEKTIALERYRMGKLARLQKPMHHLVANLYHDPKMWSGELFSATSDERATNFIRTEETLEYRFIEALKLIGDIDEALFVKNGEYPILYRAMSDLTGGVHPMIVVMLNQMMNFFPYWDKEIQDPVLWPKRRIGLMKLSQFIEFDESKYTKLLNSSE